MSATISVQTGTQHPLLVIECWDIQRTPFCVARKHGPWAGSVLFNADPSFPPSVAIQGFDEYDNQYASAQLGCLSYCQRADIILVDSRSLFQLNIYARRALAYIRRTLDILFGQSGYFSRIRWTPLHVRFEPRSTPHGAAQPLATSAKGPLRPT